MARLDLSSRVLLAAWILAATQFVTPVLAGDVPEAKRILVLSQNESSLTAVRELTAGMIDTFDRSRPGQFEIYSEYMDSVRFPDAGNLERLRQDMVAKYSGMALDSVIAIGPDALAFMLDHRDEIAPGVSVVFAAVGDSTAETTSRYADVGGVVSHFDVARTIELARRLQPGATRIVVMTGSAKFDRDWQETARKDLRVFEPDMQVDYVSGLTIDEFKRAAAGLSEKDILLILTIFEDADGRRFIPRDAVADIVPVSGAPAYSVYSSFIDAGIVGGFMETFESMGKEAAEIAIRVMRDKGTPPPVVRSAGTSVVNWRQLSRWGLDEANLPPDTQLRFYEPTLWQQYRWPVIAVAAVILLQFFTITALIVQDRRRRRMKDELALERLELARISRVTQLGELSGALAHEITQPLTSILANAEAGARLLEKDPADMREVKEIFADIIADDKRAAGVVAQLRQMMRKGEIALEVVDLNRAIAATLALARSELVARHVRIDLHRDQNDVMVRANVPQLQQIILNLLLNAADAMRDLPLAERRIVVETRMREDDARELAVSDHGPGVSPDMKDKLFEPFATTKSEGLGLGLAICRTIAQAHGGTLQVDEGNRKGARFVLALPAP
jgi:signal transduction histidine kinase